MTRISIDALIADHMEPAVPAELLDLNKSHQQFFSRVSQGHFTRAFYRKLRHEGQTGHKIKFPPAR